MTTKKRGLRSATTPDLKSNRPIKVMRHSTPSKPAITVNLPTKKTQRPETTHHSSRQLSFDEEENDQEMKKVEILSKPKTKSPTIEKNGKTNVNNQDQLINKVKQMSK